MIEKKYGIDFNSPKGALTVLREYVSDREETGMHSKTHDSGWTISGEVVEDYFYWVNKFEAYHPKYGRVWGDFEESVFADSEEGFQDFYQKHPPEAWCYEDI